MESRHKIKPEDFKHKGTQRSIKKVIDFLDENYKGLYSIEGWIKGLQDKETGKTKVPTAVKLYCEKHDHYFEVGINHLLQSKSLCAPCRVDKMKDRVKDKRGYKCVEYNGAANLATFHEPEGNYYWQAIFNDVLREGPTVFGYHTSSPRDSYLYRLGRVEAGHRYNSGYGMTHYEYLVALMLEAADIVFIYDFNDVELTKEVKKVSPEVKYVKPDFRLPHCNNLIIEVDGFAHGYGKQKVKDEIRDKAQKDLGRPATIRLKQHGISDKEFITNVLETINKIKSLK